MVSPYIEEAWTPVYSVVEGDSFNAIVANAGQRRLLGWNVVQSVRAPYCDCTKARFEKAADGAYIHAACGRSQRALAPEELVEQVRQQHIAPEDDRLYNGMYATIGGHDQNDPKSWITGGRAEYNRVIKERGLILWDAGHQKNIDDKIAQKAAARKAKLEVDKAKFVGHRIYVDKLDET